jgi:hypothetical protein
VNILLVQTAQLPSALTAFVTPIKNPRYAGLTKS